MLNLEVQTQALRPSRKSILDTIGNTPLLRLSAIAAELPETVELWAKAEWFNPGGSVKDRPALRMIEHAEAQGLLVPGKTIIDSTSGNTGVAYAMIGAAKGYPVTLVMPANVSAERKAIVHAYGAELIESDPLEGSDGAIRLVRQIVADDPERYYYPDQYSNPANWIAHYETTGPEIMAQTDGRVTHFVAGLGTTGTVIGVGRRLKHDKPGVQIIGVGPADELEVIEGLKHLATAIVPRIYDPSVVDREIPVTANEAWAMTRRLAREEGLFVGFSAGAATHAALEIARELEEGVVVTLLPDGGSKYLSLGLWK
ncbi:MAG: cysteine synthase [Anaerolineae bacterium]